MKVAIVSYYHPESSLPLAYYLAKHENTKVGLYYAMSLKNPAHPIFELKNTKLYWGINKINSANNIVELTKYIDEKNLNLYIIGYPYISYKLKFIQRLITWFCVQQIKIKGYDIYHIIGQYYSVLNSFHKFLGNKARVQTFHEAAKHHEMQEDVKLVEVIINNNIPFILHSDNVLKLLQASKTFNTELVDVIPFGVFESYRFFKKPSKQTNQHINKFLWFGRVTNYKGLELFIRAALKICDTYDSTEFIIAGAGSIDEMRLISGNKHFRVINKHLSSWELADLLNDSSAVVCTHSTASQSGIPMAAYAFNKPVISSDIPGLNHMVLHEKTGLLFRKGDVEDLYYCFQRFIVDVGLRKNFELEIENLINTGYFSWENISCMTLEKYKKALSAMRL